MQKTEHRARLLYLSTTGSIFCLVTSLLIAAAASARAGEQPVIMLAMVDHQLTAEAHELVATNPPADLASSLSKSTNNSLATLISEKEMATEVPADARLEKTTNSGADNGLQIIHENRTATGRSNMEFSVQAGYGRIWDEQSMLQKLSAGHQETGCAYVRANISF